MEKSKIIEYALNFLLANIDETTEEDLGMTHEEIEKSIEYIKNNWEYLIDNPVLSEKK